MKQSSVWGCALVLLVARVASAFMATRPPLMKQPGYHVRHQDTGLFGVHDLTATEQQRAREVFSKFDSHGHNTLYSEDLGAMLRSLDIDALDEEVEALVKYLDPEDNGEIDFDHFLEWYGQTADVAKEVARNFQNLLINRRTVDIFDQTPVDDDVLRRAVECAIAAPNRSMSEPWRFIKIGPETVKKFAELKKRLHQTMETQEGAISTLDWTTIPGWCVVTTKLTPEDPGVELEDFKSTSCAVQNFMLSMWSEGIGTKWTSGPIQKTQEFADLCGVDTAKERVAGCIWYGFASGGLVSADPKRRKKSVDDVLSSVP
jgi:nitroreductase